MAASDCDMETERGAVGAEMRECGRHGRQVHHRIRDAKARQGIKYKCRRCACDEILRRKRKVKRTLVAEAGGRCAICGYDRCPAALTFHHVDPAQKSFAMSTNIGRSLAAFHAEMLKCVLVCANCHAEIEAGLHDRLGADGHGRG